MPLWTFFADCHHSLSSNSTCQHTQTQKKMQQQPPLNIYIPDNCSQTQLETFINDHRGVANMRLVSTVESMSGESAGDVTVRSVRSNMRSMPGHERVLVIYNYDHRSGHHGILSGVYRRISIVYTTENFFVSWSVTMTSIILEWWCYLVKLVWDLAE